MKQLLLIILMFLPIFGNQTISQELPARSGVENHTITFPQPDEIPYNMEFVNALGDGIEDRGLEGFTRFFTDSVMVYSESTDEITYSESSEFVEFLASIFENTHLYNYEIFVSEVEGETLYIMNYYVIMEGPDGEPALGLILLKFLENEDEGGLIDAVLGQ